MPIQRINRIVIFAYLLLTAINVVSFVQFGHVRTDAQQALERQRQSTLEANRMIAGSKSLTNSVRAFAATGDPRHEKAYWDEVKVIRSRDLAEAALRDMGLTGGEIELIERAKANSDKLIELEDRAFKVGTEGNRAKAIELVFGDDYTKALGSIYAPVDQFRQRLDKRLLAEVADAEKKLQFWWVVSLTLAAINTLLVIFILGVLYKRRVVTPLAQLNIDVHSMLEGRRTEGNDASYSGAATEIHTLAESFAILRDTYRKAEDTQWIKTSKADLLDFLQGIDDMSEFSRRLTARLPPLLSARIGALYYRARESDRYYLIGSHGFLNRKGVVQSYASGEGLVGQCIREQAAIALTGDASDDMQFASESMPESDTAGQHYWIAAPLKAASGEIPAVIKLASQVTFGEREQALLDEVLPMLALSIHVIERNGRTRELLDESRIQAEKMEKQAARLEEQTVEMEAQQLTIKATEAWYRSIIESAPDGMLVADERGVIILANPQLEAMFAYGKGELTGKSIETLVPQAARGSHVAMRDGYLKEGTARQMAMKGRELRGTRQNGTEFPVEVGLSRLPALGERGVCVCASVRDVTERKAVEQEILRAKELAEESKNRADTFLNASTSALVIINGQAQIVDCNEGFLRLLDYQRLADVAGKHPAALAPETQPDGRNSMEKGGEMVGIAIERGRHTFDWACQDAHGISVPVEVTIVPVMLGGQPHLMGIWYDLRSRMAMEEELRAAKAAAEEATKTKSDFLANMSHEIRTPMNAIIGMSHLALQTKLDKKQKNYIEKVHRAGENLLGIINDILDFSKIEAGKMSVEAIDFRLEDVMDHLSNLVGLKAEDKGLELLFNIAPNMPTALIGDPLRLGQILINLGNNAVKFTEKGEIIVGGEMVGQAQTDQGGEAELHFWVRDSGIGMTSEQCGKMFQSFSQADASTTRKYGGTGLGLVISKNLVELMHGKIWVESEAGKGSSFHFHIKLGVQKEPMARRKFRADELLGVRVLVVDDNASAREILASMTKDFGLEVDAARNGQNALQMIAEAEKKHLPYDLVLMDWKMPGMDGIETVQKMQDEHLGKVPAVIMVTAYGREEALGSAEQQGVQLKTVLTKPVTQASLLEAIGDVLGKGDLVETRAEEKAESYEDAMAQLKGARVLLAEDNEMNQELAMELLAQAGIEVVLANNGQEAVDILSKDARFDGVLMDCQMPVMDGYTATRAIRKLPQFEKLPILAMTANAMAGDKEKVIEAGMWDHIAKPLNVGEMFATIAKWIKPAASRVGAGGTAPSPSPSKGEGSAGLPTLPGIDVKAGMATCTNKESLYARMLVKFRDSQDKFGELFAAALQDADPVAPARTAHTLKGTAGNIGAKALQAAAGELEHACNEKAPAERIDFLLQKALAELAVVMPGLEKVGASVANMETAVVPGKAPAIPKAELEAALDKLRGLLEDSDSEAGDLLDDLLDKLGNAPFAKQLKPVALAIEGFDFDAALEKLNGI